MTNKKNQNPAQSKQKLNTKVVFAIKLVLAFLIAYSFAEFAHFYNSNTTIYNIVYGLNTFLTSSILISVGRFLLISWYGRRSGGNERIRANAVLGINQASGVLEIVFVVVGLMLAFGIDPREFLTSITLVAMAIALLFRDYITNMISGLLIMFSDRFTIGDQIRIGEYSGKIIDITLSNIIIRNEDEDLVLIPNNTAFTLNIVNQTLENKRKMIIVFQLPTEKSPSKTQLEKIIRDEISAMSEQILVDSVQFRIVSIRYTDIEYKLSFLLQTQTKAKKAEIKDRILTKVTQRQEAFAAN